MVKKQKRTSKPKVTIAKREPANKIIKSLMNTRLVIPGEKVPSGKLYTFEQEEVKSVIAADATALLRLKRKQGQCCGGGKVKDLAYFQEVT